MSWIGKQINSRQEFDVQKKHLKNSLNEMEWDVNTWRSQNGSNVHIYMCMLIDSLRCINVKIEIIQHLIFQRDVIHASLRYFNRKCSTVNKFSVAFLISHKIFVRRTSRRSMAKKSCLKLVWLHYLNIFKSVTNFISCACWISSLAGIAKTAYTFSRKSHENCATPMDGTGYNLFSKLNTKFMFIARFQCNAMQRNGRPILFWYRDTSSTMCWNYKRIH